MSSLLRFEDLHLCRTCFLFGFKIITVCCILYICVTYQTYWDTVHRFWKANPQFSNAFKINYISSSEKPSMAKTLFCRVQMSFDPKTIYPVLLPLPRRSVQYFPIAQAFASIAHTYIFLSNVYVSVVFHHFLSQFIFSF